MVGSRQGAWDIEPGEVKGARQTFFTQPILNQTFHSYTHCSVPTAHRTTHDTQAYKQQEPGQSKGA